MRRNASARLAAVEWDPSRRHLQFYANAATRIGGEGTRVAYKREGKSTVQGIAMRDKIALLERRRDDIRDWLEDEAPHTAFDQKHLEVASDERAYWHHGYQAALNDVIDLLNPARRRSGTVGIPN
jgi:hypothetical protein